MREATLARIGALVAAGWAGEMVAIGGLAAPALFAALPRAEAGLAAGRLFGADATFGIVAGAIVLMAALQLGRLRAERGAGRRFSAEMALALGAVACIVFGHFALQPMMVDARAGQAALSFGALHGISTGLFALRAVLVATLAWRLSSSPPR